jgi:hypothetical protein
MPKRRYFIPLKDGDFFNFQGQMVNKVQAKKADWDIPDSAVDVLVNHRMVYEPLYHKSQSKNSRTTIDVVAHRRERKAYEKDIRKFVNARIRFNDLMTDSDRISIGVPARDTEPSPKPKINDIPFVGLTPLGGGWIKVTCKRETDENRPSMHDFADVIECRYTLVLIQPGVRKPWPTLDDCKEVITSTKAHFIIKCDDKNAGQHFYGFFRWANLTNPQNSGPWSNAKTVVIA